MLRKRESFYLYGDGEEQKRTARYQDELTFMYPHDMNCRRTVTLLYPIKNEATDPRIDLTHKHRCYLASVYFLGASAAAL